MRLFKGLQNLITHLRRVFYDRRGAGNPDILPDVLCGAVVMQNIVIGGVTYLVRSYFRKDTTTTALDKITRLIEKDAENSQ